MSAHPESTSTVSLTFSSVTTTTPDLFDALADRLADKVAARVLAGVPSPHAAEPWRLLTAKETGELLGRSERWVYEASNVDASSYLRLPYVDVGGVKRFDPEALKAWAQARQIPRNDPPTPEFRSIPARYDADPGEKPLLTRGIETPVFDTYWGNRKFASVAPVVPTRTGLLPTISSTV